GTAPGPSSRRSLSCSPRPGSPAHPAPSSPAAPGGRRGPAPAPRRPRGTTDGKALPGLRRAPAAPAGPPDAREPRPGRSDYETPPGAASAAGAPSSARSPSATRSASAMIVRYGLISSAFGKRLASATRSHGTP